MQSTTRAAETAPPTPPPAPQPAPARHSWFLATPLIFVVSVLAVLLVIGAFAVDLVRLRRQHLTVATQQIEHHSRMLAEHVARALSGAPLIVGEPGHFEEFCAANRPFAEYEAALVDTEGSVIALCRAAPELLPLPENGPDFRTLLAGGSFIGLSLDRQTTLVESDNHILVSEPVPGYPALSVVSAASKASLLTQWQQQARQTLLIGIVALLALGCAALLIRRQFAEIARFAEELRLHRDTLESRVAEATRELERRRIDAELAADAKSRFLTAASHDLRQPLHALRLFIGQLLRASTGDERTQLIQRIEQAGDAMGRQLEGMLDLSRLDMSCIKPQWTAVAIDELFRQLAATYRPAADARDVYLVFSPRCRQVLGDSVLIFRLLGNLIDNAIKFSPGGTVLVAARWRPDGGTRIDVRDNGSGIAAEFQQVIYEDFFQIENRARDASAGLGLGLSIVSRISRLLDTPVRLRSRPGAGSTFSLQLSKAQPLAPVREENAPLPLILVGRLGNSIRSFSRRAAEWGYQPENAPDAATAAELLAEYSARTPILVIFCIRKQAFDTALEALARANPSIVIHAEDREIGHLGPYHLSLPLKPARVRALLRSLHPASPHDRED